MSSHNGLTRSLWPSGWRNGQLEARRRRCSAAKSQGKRTLRGWTRKLKGKHAKLTSGLHKMASRRRNGLLTGRKARHSPRVHSRRPFKVRTKILCSNTVGCRYFLVRFNQSQIQIGPRKNFTVKIACLWQGCESLPARPRALLPTACTPDANPDVFKALATQKTHLFNWINRIL